MNEEYPHRVNDKVYAAKVTGTGTIIGLPVVWLDRSIGFDAIQIATFLGENPKVNEEVIVAEYRDAPEARSLRAWRKGRR